MDKKYTAILVSHTHWDREWYRTFQGFRLRLVKLIDKLLDILETDPEYKSFTLDGQTIVLEDYLEIRPENKGRLKKYVQEGRLFIGPWYVLCDEFLVSGEAIVRNLMLGHKIAKEFGPVMKIGYIPDPFGHISQMPQILSGFGIDSAFFHRGLGEEWEGLKTEFLWEAPDGTRVLGVFQRNGYCNAASLGYKFIGGETTGLRVDMEDALRRVQSELEKLGPIASTPFVLLNNGCDHLEPQPELPEIIKYVNAKLENAQVIQGTFEEYVAGVRSRSPELGKIKGELHCGKYHPLLSGTLSTRMYLKQENHKTQTLLERYAEPLSAIAWLLGGEHQEAFLWQAWKYCLSNHPHDSICGCSVDQVHKEMLPRFHQGQQIAEELSEQSLAYIASKIETRPEEKEKWTKSIVVFNPLGFARTEAIRIRIGLAEELGRNMERLQVKDPAGQVVPCQVSLVMPEGVYDRRGAEIEICFLAEEVPPCGYKTYTLRIAEGFQLSTSLKVGLNTLENEFFKVKVEQNGTLSILDKRTERTYGNCNLFEDTEDAGDEYDYSPAYNSQVLTSANERARIRLVECGPVCATYGIDLDLNLPESLVPNRTKRSEKLVRCPLSTYVTLYPKIPRIDILTKFTNRAKDHRLRALFPTDIRADYAAAEEQFGVVERSIELPEGKNWVQKPVGTKPQKTFVAVSDPNGGLAIVNQGLPEYEIKRTSEGDIICLTLLRGVGWLSKDDFPARPYNAGPSIPTPEAQCLGEHEFRYSIVPHAGNWESACLWEPAHSFNVPMKALVVDSHGGELPKELSFISLEPANLVLSTIKKAEGRDSLILRLYNTTSKETEGTLKLFQPIKKARLTNLNEEPIEELGIKNSKEVPLKVPGFRIVTVEIAF